jgi:hypothetical protein
MGHAGGMAMSDLRRATTSPYISNTLPRNRSSANIVVPLQLRDLTLAFAAPYYIGVKQQEELAAASPPHNSIPRRGFVLTGAKVLKDFQLSVDLPFLQVSTASVYSGARILQQIAPRHPHLTTSQNVVESALQTELTARVPPGALAYPRYKVASISFAASDVELHCLHSDVHFGPRQAQHDRF